MAVVDINVVPVLQAVGVGVVRSAAGWLNNALEDGKITKFELAKLGETVVRVGLITGALYYGVTGLFGVEVSTLGAAAGAYVFDRLLKALKK